jgi:hypothetical protein
MSFFITEKATEALLELETRVLPLPGSLHRPITAFRLVWESLDYLVICGRWSRLELTTLAQQNAREVGCSFEDSLRDTLATLHRDLRRKQGIDD